MTSPLRRWPAVLAALCLLTAACGSTVQLDGATPAAGEPLEVAADDGLTAAPQDMSGTDPLAAAGSTGASAGGTTGGAGGSAGGVTGGPAASGRASGEVQRGGRAPAPSAPASGGGAGKGDDGAATGARDTTPIRLGFIVLKNGEAFVAGMGTEASFGNGRRHAQAVVDDLNARGGIAGHKIEPYYAEVDAAAPDQESAYAGACAKLTQDDRVFAILTPLNIRESAVSCAAQARTPLINASFNPGDDYLYRRFGDYFYSPSLLNLDNGVRLMLSTLRANGRFKTGVKVGVLYTSVPQFERVVEGTYVPTLKAYGVPHVVAGAAAYNAAQINSAQLKVAAEGVNLVMFMAPNGINQLLFMQQAEQQRYRPKYFTTDTDSTRFVSQNAPRAQARNISGVGTLPIANVPADQYPSNAQEQRCLKIIRERSGENTTNRLSSLTATLYCELVWEFGAVVERVRGPLTVDAWRAAYPSVGRRYPPVSTFGMDLGTGRHDNATLYRPYAWSDRCTCITYTAKAKRIPR